MTNASIDLSSNVIQFHLLLDVWWNKRIRQNDHADKLHILFYIQHQMVLEIKHWLQQTKLNVVVVNTHTNMLDKCGFMLQAWDVKPNQVKILVCSVITA